MNTQDRINAIIDEIADNEYWLNSGLMSNERKIKIRRKRIAKLNNELKALNSKSLDK